MPLTAPYINYLRFLSVNVDSTGAQVLGTSAYTRIIHSIKVKNKTNGNITPNINIVRGGGGNGFPLLQNVVLSPFESLDLLSRLSFNENNENAIDSVLFLLAGDIIFGYSDGETNFFDCVISYTELHPVGSEVVNFTSVLQTQINDTERSIMFPATGTIIHSFLVNNLCNGQIYITAYLKSGSTTIDLFSQVPLDPNQTIDLLSSSKKGQDSDQRDGAILFTQPNDQIYLYTDGATNYCTAFVSYEALLELT